jgi:hypothetical protein
MVNVVLIAALLWMPIAAGHGGARVFEILQWGSRRWWRAPVLSAKITILMLAGGAAMMRRWASAILGLAGCVAALVTWALFILSPERNEARSVPELFVSSGVLVSAIMARLFLVWLVVGQITRAQNSGRAWGVHENLREYLLVALVLAASVVWAAVFWTPPPMPEFFKR